MAMMAQVLLAPQIRVDPVQCSPSRLASTGDWPLDEADVSVFGDDEVFDVSCSRVKMFLDLDCDFRLLSKRSASTSTPATARTVSNTQFHLECGFDESGFECDDLIDTIDPSVEDSLKFSLSGLDLSDAYCDEPSECASPMLAPKCSLFQSDDAQESESQDSGFDSQSQSQFSDTCSISSESDVACSLADSSQSDFESDLQCVLQKCSPKEADRLIGRKMGLECLDITTSLYMHNKDSLSVLFSYLEPEDLCRACSINKTWHAAIKEDRRAFNRKTAFLRMRKLNPFEKENSRVVKWQSTSVRAERGLTESFSKQPLQSVQLSVSQLSTSVEQPAITSPGLVKSQRFWQVADSLKFDESLRHCPKCQHPARVHEGQERAWCSNHKCAYDFCIKCRSTFHGAKDCVAAVAKKTKTESSVGTRKSKKNLRRL